MRAVLQRVVSASVTIDEKTAAEIGRGLVVLLGVERGDGPEDARRLAAKVADLRIFAAGESHFDRSLLETGAEALVVSQFTLFADVRKGRRPSFTNAAPPEEASGLVDAFTEELRGLGVPVGTGRFGEHMIVKLENDGPVTIVIDTAELARPRRQHGSS